MNVQNGLLRAIVQYYNQHTHYPKVDDDSLAKDETKTSELRCKLQCNREGAFFVRAQTMCVIDDFGNVIEQHLKLMRLVPTVE